MNNLAQQLKQMPQIDIPRDIFTDIQSGLDKRSYVNKHKFINMASIAALALLTVLFLNQQQSIDEKDVLINELVKRTMQLEQLVLVETPTRNIPGSQITERIVNMETWLTKLDQDIKQTKDKRKLSELMAVKLDILGNLVMLQRKINQKPDFQKIKPYVI